jgi:TolA-binding protein
MSDPPRLLEGESIERELIEAWGSMRGPSQARDRALALAGASLATTVAVASGAPTITSAGPAASGAAAASTKAIVVKWFGVIGLAAIVGGGVAFAIRDAASGPIATEAATSPVAPNNAVESLASAPTTPSISVDDLIVVPTVRPVASAKGDSLTVQLKALDTAREALAGGDPARALRELDAFDVKYPASPLAVEAGTLRFDALVAKGDLAAAQRVARAFVARWPESPYSPRFRRALETNP